MIIRGILDIKLYNGKRTDIAGGLHKEMGRKIRGLERKFAADCVVRLQYLFFYHCII